MSPSTWNQHLKHNWTLPRYGFVRKLFRDSRSLLRPGAIHSTQKINDMNCSQLIFDPSTCVKKRAQRSDDSIPLRHMDDVVSTGPEEHLMSDFEHMKTSPYLTDVVVLRHEGDTVNFLGLEINMARRGFEVKNSTDLMESVLKLYWLQNSKPTVNPGRRSTVMELASATPLDGHDYSNFCTAVGKLIFLAPWRPDMQFAIQRQSTQVLKPTTESKRAMKQLIRISKARNTRVFVLNRAKWFKQVCWNSLVAVTQIGPAIRQHARVLRDVIAMCRT